MQHEFDGFWFPSPLRQALISPDRSFTHLHFKRGTQVPDGDNEAVTVRWPLLDVHDWQRALSLLKESRAGASRIGPDRLPRAVQTLKTLWADRSNPLRQSMLEALETCTGHSVGMLDVALSLLELISVEDLVRAASGQLTHAVKDSFVALDSLPGRVRFFAKGWAAPLAERVLLKFDGYRERPWILRQRPSGLILGYAAGNVPGTGLLLALLGWAAAAGRQLPPPVILIKNSRREPLFSPLVLAALEQVDPALVSTTLVTIWDYEDMAVQEYLLTQADLVIAAASDDTIESIGQHVDRASSPSRPIRFHRHGHKVSFSTLGRECLEKGRRTPQGIPLVEVVALLASLDVALWNQQGCLSSRVHFVEQGSDGSHCSPETYGRAVVEGLRALNRSMPKGILRKRQIHNLFDKYQSVAARGGVNVLSEYDDDFLVVLDRREVVGEQFREVVNDCQGRTVSIIPVNDILEVPKRYLSHVSRSNLQSMSVALGDPDQPGLDARLLDYAEALGAVGVTSIRTVGRGAFPQLAYSWDGFIPLDLTVERAKGHFTALEFDEPWAQIYKMYSLIRRAMNSQP